MCLTRIILHKIVNRKGCPVGILGGVGPYHATLAQWLETEKHPLGMHVYLRRGRRLPSHQAPKAKGSVKRAFRCQVTVKRAVAMTEGRPKRWRESYDGNRWRYTSSAEIERGVGDADGALHKICTHTRMLAFRSSYSGQWSRRGMLCHSTAAVLVYKISRGTTEYSA